MSLRRAFHVVSTLRLNRAISSFRCDVFSHTNSNRCARNLSTTALFQKAHSQKRCLHYTPPKFSEIVDVQGPAFAESITEGDVRWVKEEGDWVNVDDVVAQIETDKTTVEVPAPFAGKIVKFLVPDGEKVTAKQVIYQMEKGGAADSSASSPKDETPQESEEPPASPPKSEKSSASGEIVDVQGPTFAESISEGDIRWVKEEGDSVNVDDVVAQIETDKTTVEVPAPFAGKIVKFLVPDGEKVTAKQVLYQMQKGGESGGVEPPRASEPASSHTRSSETLQKPTIPKSAPPVPEPPKRPMRSKPTADIGAVKAALSAAGPLQSDSTKVTGDRSETRVKINRMRLRIAERLKDAQNTYAMLTTFNEVDMTNVIKMRKKYQDAFVKKHGIKLGLMSPFVRASAIALQDQPVVNAVIEGGEIVYRNFCDISIAVATPKGLVVPVVRNVETMNYAVVEKTLAELGAKARDGKMAIEDMEGGTFTISNGGVFGSVFGTPIINPPQSAILGMHGIFDRVVAIDGKPEVRPMMYIALTYDHRLIDGREAVLFLLKVKQAVEDPVTILLDL